jgi:hypothetical protein
MRRLTSRHLVAIAVLASTATTASVSLAVLRSTNSVQPVHIGPSRGMHHPPPGAKRLADRVFAVLKRVSAVASDVGPSDVGSSNGVPALVQGQFTASVFQEPSGSICIQAGSPGEGLSIGCAPVQEAASVGLTLLTSGVGEQTRITVLVPNGVSGVTVATPSEQLSGAVSNNVASVVVDGKFLNVSYKLPDGQSHTWVAPRTPAEPAPAAG